MRTIKHSALALLLACALLLPASAGIATSPAKISGVSLDVHNTLLNFTKDAAGVVTVQPTEVQIDNMLRQTGGGAITFDLSQMDATTGLRLLVDPSWFEDAAGMHALVMVVPTGLRLELSGKALSHLHTLVNGTCDILLQTGTPMVAVRQNDKDLPLASFGAPLTISLPVAEGTETAVLTDSITNSVVPRSWTAEGMVHGRVYGMGNFAAKTVARPVFADTKGKWMQEAVSDMAVRGVVAGVSDSSFAPQGTVTRAQFVTMLMRLMKAELQGLWMPAPFADQSDIPDWALKAVNQASAMGFLQGDAAGNFNPGAPITREDMFLITHRAMGKFGMLPEVLTQQFVEFGDWDALNPLAGDAVQTLAKLGLVQGDGGKLNPAGTSTRAEAAQFLYNVWKYDAQQ